MQTNIQVKNIVKDLKTYLPNVHEDVVAGIVRHCGIALQSKDASLVSASDPAELERVRENFLVKKLGREESEADLDAAIAAVVSKMSAERNKSRVTVYYLLAEHFGQLGDFVRSAEKTESVASSQHHAAITAQLNEIYAVEDNSLEPGIDALSLEALRNQDWSQ